MEKKLAIYKPGAFIKNILKVLLMVETEDEQVGRDWNDVPGVMNTPVKTHCFCNIGIFHVGWFEGFANKGIWPFT